MAKDMNLAAGSFKVQVGEHRIAQPLVNNEIKDKVYKAGDIISSSGVEAHVFRESPGKFKEQ